MPTLSALRLTDGALVWRHRAPEPAKCSFEGRCGNGYSGPPSLANGVLFGVNQDGHVRAFEAKTGKLIWDYDTAGRRYETVNGVKNQRGGNLDATGMTFAGGDGLPDGRLQRRLGLQRPGQCAAGLLGGREIAAWRAAMALRGEDQGDRRSTWTASSPAPPSPRTGRRSAP